MDTIRDMLSVGQDRQGNWVLHRWDGWPAPQTVATVPREDEAWGVTSLILEYVERRGMSVNTAIDAALTCYRQASAEHALTDLDSAPAPDDLAYQDHAHLMGYVC